ncbi:ABC transporter ATP-binding protein [Candidatus Persebacteraceae bacterium Df01]|uniref:ABC transporter ATP-binding protein n=1 Tax=Candidatus Doriopsillibacter californiensis TaxID=2970740 RepID=A0ABT7QMS9_9GAMM|nr:ABC transporter ATP-binding protein [Candidatus Persebacteraceae bacterium Df01]
MIYQTPDGGKVEALRDISFQLNPGEILTILGPSGCGKTTLLNILAGFLAPTSGRAIFGNDEINSPSSDRAKIDNLITGPDPSRGMVFQQGALFEWLNVSENIGFGPKMRGVPAAEISSKVEHLLDTVGLGGFGDKAIYELSGGMQQRVALARCLANEPELILMDEPLGALDALTREKMQSLILKLWRETGKTIVLITHSVEEALFLGERLFVMAPRPGRIEKQYQLPFAERGLNESLRDIKATNEFSDKRDEILAMIWEMEEEIMGRQEANA